MSEKEDCIKCEGRGRAFVPGIWGDKLTTCPACNGKCKVDWIDNLTQKEKPKPRRSTGGTGAK